MQLVSKQFVPSLQTPSLQNPTNAATINPLRNRNIHQTQRRSSIRMARIQEVAQQIQSAWENSAQLSKPGVHFGSGFARTAVDSMLTNAVNRHVKHPHAKGVLTQLSKTAGLAAQISMLKPGAFTLGMGVIIGLGGSASHTVKSLARLLGHVYLLKALLAVAHGNFAAANSLVASVGGAYAGKMFSELVHKLHTSKPADDKPVDSTDAQKGAGNSTLPVAHAVLRALTTMTQAMQKTDRQLSQAIDHYLHPNFLLRQLLPVEQLQQIQPALSARVSIGARAE